MNSLYVAFNFIFALRAIWHPLPKEEDIAEETRLNLEEGGRAISTLLSSQLQILRKLALLKLTAHMEKYCPSHRTGWNWDLPKFIRKIKSPIYKGSMTENIRWVIDK